ncbi:MAG: YigZ family protein [Candidatus Gracilibacteria bacterium]|nr:YigZ family protein [Candidatus Gracilibacteria bacterium]
MNQFAMDFGDNLSTEETFIIYKNVIVDRKSKYTTTGGKVKSEEEVKQFIKNLNKNKYFQKATHNSYAYIIKGESGALIEGKNDDGETGAGMCILRELKRENAVNLIVVVTRIFGGVYLQADRFKNVIDASKLFLNKLK